MIISFDYSWRDSHIFTIFFCSSSNNNHLLKNASFISAFNPKRPLLITKHKVLGAKTRDYRKRHTGQKGHQKAVIGLFYHSRIKIL